MTQYIADEARFKDCAVRFTPDMIVVVTTKMYTTDFLYFYENKAKIIRIALQIYCL